MKTQRSQNFQIIKKKKNRGFLVVQQVRFGAPNAGFDPWSERNYDPHAPRSTEKGRTGGGAEGTPPEINRGRPIQQPASPPTSLHLRRTPSS